PFLVRLEQGVLGRRRPLFENVELMVGVRVSLLFSGELLFELGLFLAGFLTLLLRFGGLRAQPLHFFRQSGHDVAGLLRRGRRLWRGAPAVARRLGGDARKRTVRLELRRWIGAIRREIEPARRRRQQARVRR